jgi:hypothetical protein
MQVSHVKEVDTHAVIGGGVARSFGIADSVEFYGMLSSAIYRDGKRAMIREVICNGWDAHIMGGCTDKHVEISLTDDEIIFKDFGPGIPDRLIDHIYCVYGASTKVKDANQTGGFGLGSKSPFAYTDHFTVDSRNAGLRNVYALSKGGASTEGRPEIRPMVENLPTDETGVTVTIPLRDKSDRYELSQIIRSVAYQGGMLVKLNGEELRRVDYTPARKQGFCTIAHSGMHESAVYLLYGTVLYPVTTTDTHVYEAAKKAASLIGEGYKLVLIAPPNSIGVTPSRESLNYTELTMATVLKLLKRATNVIEAAIPGAGKKFVTLLAEKHDLTSPNEKNILSVYPPRLEGLIVIDPQEIAAYAVKCKPDRLPLNLRRKYLFAGLRKKHFDMRAPLRRAFREGLTFDLAQQRYDFRRFVKLAAKLKLLDGAMIYDNNEEFGGAKRMTSIREGLNNSGSVEPILFVAPNRRELTSMIVGMKDDPTDRDESFFVGLVVGAKPSRDLLQRIEKMAETFKFEVESYDFEWEKPKVVRVKNTDDEKYHNLDNYMEDRNVLAPELQNPKFFMRARTHDNRMLVGIDDYSARYMLKDLYPGVAIVTTKAQEEKLRKAGAVNIIEELGARLAKMVKSREVQYGYSVDRKLFVEQVHRYDEPVGKTAVELAKMHIDVAKAIFPDRVKVGENWKLAKRLIKIIETFPTGSQGLEWQGVEHPVGLISLIGRNALETFKHLVVSQKDCAKRLGYLGVLVDSAWIDEGKSLPEPKKEQLLAFIRFLQRSGSKSKLTSRNDNAANTIKEAA